MEEINLLPSEEKIVKTYTSLQKKLKIVSTVVLVITGIFTSATLIFYMLLINEKAKLVSQIEASSTKINSFKAKEELIFVTKGKVTTANKILSGRVNYPVFLKNLSDLIPEGIYFTDVRFNPEKIAFVGKAKSSIDMAGLISSLVSTKGSEILNNISIDSLNADEKGFYAFGITAQLVVAKPESSK